MKKILKSLTHYYRLYIYRRLFGNIAYARKLGVSIGAGCRIYIRHFGSEPFLISIGNNVTITADVKLITHDGSTWLIRDKKGRRYNYKPIKIGDNVFIGVNSIILPGVKVENNVIIAAGSVVTKSIPENSIVAGTPAKLIGKFSEFETNAILNYVSDFDMKKHENYKDRILQVVNWEFKNYLK